MTVSRNGPLLLVTHTRWRNELNSPEFDSKCSWPRSYQGWRCHAAGGTSCLTSVSVGLPSLLLWSAELHLGAGHPRPAPLVLRVTLPSIISWHPSAVLHKDVAHLRMNCSVIFHFLITFKLLWTFLWSTVNTFNSSFHQLKCDEATCSSQTWW